MCPLRRQQTWQQTAGDLLFERDYPERVRRREEREHATSTRGGRGSRREETGAAGAVTDLAYLREYLGDGNKRPRLE